MCCSTCMLWGLLRCSAFANPASARWWTRWGNHELWQADSPAVPERFYYTQHLLTVLIISLVLVTSELVTIMIKPVLLRFSLGYQLYVGESIYILGIVPCGSTCDSVLTWDSPQTLGPQLRSMVQSLPFRGVGLPCAVQVLGTWVCLSSSLHSEVRLLGVLADSPVSGKSKERRVISGQGPLTLLSEHLVLVLSLCSRYLFPTLVHSVSMSEAVCRIYLICLSEEEKSSGSFGFPSKKELFRVSPTPARNWCLRATLSLRPARCTLLAQPAARGVSLGLTHRMRGRPAFRDLCPLLR